MRTSSLRHVIVALTIAVSAATVHGAWFASTDANEAAPIITISTWDYYEKSWTSATHDLANYSPANPLTLRHSEDTIVAISGTTLSLPSGLNAETLDAQALAAREIPEVVGADQYLHLLVSKPANLVASWPVLGGGPTDPTDADRAALDVDGSVGVHDLTVGTAAIKWDIGRWSKGDIFLGLNNHTYKVLDRHGNFKRFVASADYDEYHNDAGADDWNVTTGCATNWKTGEMYATNFADYYPAVNIIGRHPVDNDDSPYSQASRRVLTRIDRTDDAGSTAYKHPYTSVNYPIDSSPESVAFDADMNLFVGHSFGNFRQVPAAWESDPNKPFYYESEWSEYTMAVDGLPLEGSLGGNGWVVDENGFKMLLAPAGETNQAAFQPQQYGNDVSPRLVYEFDNLGRVTAVAKSPAGTLYPNAVLQAPHWSASMDLPQSYLSDSFSGAPLHRWTGTGLDTSLITSRWSIGKRLHMYSPTPDGAYVGSEGGEAAAQRTTFWTFSGRQGTDWIDLDVTGEVMYYTSEDSYIHRYRIKEGANGEPVGQLPDVGVDLTVNGVPTYGKLAVAQSAGQALALGGGSLADYRFHGMRILPPGDGSGGFLVAIENGLGVHRFNGDGKWVQRYWALVDQDRNPATPKMLVGEWYTLEVDPGGKTFWASSRDNGFVFQFDIATGKVVKEIDAVDYVPFINNQGVIGGRRVEGICIMWEYTAPQEICFKADGTADGVDDDGDGYVDENCKAIAVCSAVSPGDDDGDTLPDQYDSDCSAEMPPVAVDDTYAMNQQSADPNPTVLTVTAADGVLKHGAVDYDRDSGEYADVSALKVVSFGANEANVSAAPGASITTAGNGTVVLQQDGSFVYTPDPSFHGVDTFAYKITDGYPISPDDRAVPNDGHDDLATVTITVAPKVAADGPFDVWVGETLSMGGLLTNDPAQTGAPSAGPVTISEAGPSTGPVAFTGSRTFTTANTNSVTVNADGSFSFAASNLAFGGPDYFTYAAHDTTSRSWNIATVTINVRRPVITVVVPDQVKSYDGAPLPTTCAVTSDRVAEPTYTLTYAGTIRGGAAYGPTPTAPTAAGTYTATCVHTDVALGPKSDTGSIVINPVPLTVTASDTSRVYFAANPVPTRVITGFVNGENESGAVTGSTTCSTGVAQSANVGTYPDANTCSATLSATNYTFSYVPGDLTITGAVLTVKASDTEKSYGEPNPNVTYSISGFLGTDDAAVVGGATTCTTVGGPNAGTYPGANTCSAGLTATNYSFVYEPGTLIINKVPLVVTASATSKVYGAANPPVGHTITGFTNGDDAGDLGGSTACSTAPTAGPNVGTYAEANTCAPGLTSLNYTFTYEPAALTITQAPLVVTADDKSKAYDGQVFSGAYTVTYSGFVGDDDASDLGGALTFSGAATSAVTPGTYTNGIVPAGYTSINYAISYVPGTLRIDPPVLIVTADNKAKGYDGTAYSPFTVTFSGFLGDDDASDLGGTLTFSGAATTAVNAGTYTGGIVPAGYTSSTYTIQYVAGTLTIDPAPLVVTADDKSKLYDGQVYSGAHTVTYSGFVPGDDASDLGGTLTFGGPAATAINAATYTDGIVPAGYTSSNYTISYEPGTLTITPVPLVVTAADTSKAYNGSVFSAFTVTYSGFVGGDDAGDLGGALTFSGPATTAVNVGTYTNGIVPAGYTSSNYTISYQPGTLTITPIPAVVQANDKTIYVGDPLPTFDGVWTGLVAGETATAVYTTTAVDGNTIGSYPITPTPDNSPVLANYVVTARPGTLTIVPRVAPCSGNDGYTTYSQGGWGSKPSGNNPGALLARHFSTVYPSGVVIGGTYTLTFTSASDVEKFLPAGGPSKPLTASAVNPTKSAAGNIAAQLLALRLATDFSAAGITKRGLGSLVMQSGPLAGRTVNQILDLANAVVGGQPSALPTGLSISGLSSILESLNLNYHEGTVNEGLLACGGGVTDPGNGGDTGGDPGDGDPGDEDPGDGDPGNPPAPACTFRTQTQGGWGSSPSGNNPGAFLAANWSRLGTVVIGTGSSARTFTSASAVEAYLPAGGSNVLSGQVLALTLSVRFSNAGVTTSGLGNLKVKSGAMAGYTVSQVLALANTALSTGSAGGFSKNTLNSVVDAINNNFVDGNTDKGYLVLGSCATS